VALVVFLRGVNVGGHRTFRPTKLAEALQHLGAVNIGAAGTLVIRQRMTQAQARAEVARNLPFVAEIVVCQGRDIGCRGYLCIPVAARPVPPHHASAVPWGEYR